MGPTRHGDRIVVLCRDAADRPPHLAPIEARAEIIYTDAATLPNAIEAARVLFLWDFFSTAVRDVWDRAGYLEWIHVAAAGVDTLLFDELKAADVVVTNARGVFDRPIAEFVLAAILAHAKDLRTGYELQRRRTWRHRETTLVRGTTALIVGTGPIGRETARLLHAVGIDVRGAGRTGRTADPDFGTVVATHELARHVGWADHLVMAAPLTRATRGLLDAAVFQAMRPTAHLINVGRGATVVEGDLVAALREGRLAAATLDVFEREPLHLTSPLWTTPGVTVTAHMSGDVAGWRDALARQFVANAQRWLNGEPLINVVDKQLGYVPTSE